MVFSRKVLLLSALSLLWGAGCGGSSNPASEDVGSSSIAPSSSSVLSSSSIALSSSSVLSSSSIAPSSSSVLSSSSSLSVWCDTVGNCGTLTDSRDGKTYRWAKIGTQTWMAQNLDFGTRVAGTADQSDATASNAQKYCYGDQESNCAMYGGLYQWHTVMALPFTCNSTDVGTAPCIVSTPHRGICPEGWHVPTREEWAVLDTWVDTDNGRPGDDEGTSLKSTNLWSGSGAGTDAYGWSGLPGGYNYIGYFYDQGFNGTWWSASQYNFVNNNAWSRDLHYRNAKLRELFYARISQGFSARCLQD